MLVVELVRNIGERMFDVENKTAHIRNEAGLINVRDQKGDLLCVTHSKGVKNRCVQIYKDFINKNIKSKEEYPDSFNWSQHRCDAVRDAEDLNFDVVYTPGLDKGQREKIARQMDQFSISVTVYSEIWSSQRQYVPMYETVINSDGENYYWISGNSVKDQSDTDKLVGYLNKIHPGKNFTSGDVVSNKPVVIGNKSLFTKAESQVIAISLNEMMQKLGYISLRKKIKAA